MVVRSEVAVASLAEEARLRTADVEESPLALRDDRAPILAHRASNSAVASTDPPGMTDLFASACRLRRGEIIDVTDPAGRRWRASATTLTSIRNDALEPFVVNADPLAVARVVASQFVDAPRTG